MKAEYDYSSKYFSDPDYTIYSYGSTGGFSGSSGFGLPEEKEVVPYISGRMRKITIKEEPSMEESVERFRTTLMEGVMRMVSASFYGVLGIKVKRTEEPVLTGRIKKIKER
jgi:hypothetical protein